MAAPDDCRHPLSAFPADVNNLTSENLNRGQRSPYLQFSTSWQSCGHLPCVRDSSCLGGHGTYLAVQEHIEAISRGFLSEAIRLWWCVLITPSAHSLSLNCLLFSCLSCCLLYVGQPFKCCQSVFVWTPIILALPSHPPSTHTRLYSYLACFCVGLHELACLPSQAECSTLTSTGLGWKQEKLNGFMSATQCSSDIRSSR